MSKATVTSMFGTKIHFEDDRDGQVAMEVGGYDGILVSASELRAAIDKVDPPKIANQERNREALIDHIDELQRIILQCNQQIENQARNAEEDQRAIEEIGAERDEYRAMHSEQMKTIARLQENPRPLTADDLSDEELRKRTERVQADVLRAHREGRDDWARIALFAALTPPPVTLESIVDEALDKYTGGYLNGDEVGPYVASKYAELTDGSN